MAVAAGATSFVQNPLHSQCDYDLSIVAGSDCGNFGSPTRGRGINEEGLVAGDYTLCAIGTGEAFLWDGGPNLTTLQRPAGIGGAGAWDVNDSGVVAGAMFMDSVGDRAFIHDGTSFIDLGVPRGASQSFGRGINNRGDVVGKWGTGINAFLYRDGVMIDLMSDLGTRSGEALDINDVGQVVGWMGSSLSNARAYIWQDGVVVDLGVISGGRTAEAHAINNRGWVAGSGRVRIAQPPFVASRAFLWNGSDMSNLGTLPGFDLGSASDLNDQGQVVGRAWSFDNQEAGFIWQSGVMTDLNDLIPPNTGVQLTWATAINNQGQITGQGETVTGDIVAVLLTPVKPRVSDLDGNCHVGTSDLLTLLALWGPCPAPCPSFCPGDLHGDCSVGVNDLLTVLENWD